MNSGVYAARCSALTVGDILCKEYAFVFVIFSASDVWFFYLISSKLNELMLCLENANPRTISLTLAFLMFFYSLTPKSSNPFFEPLWKRILRNVYFAFLKTRKMENSVACHAAIQPDSAPPQPPSLATGSEGSTQLPCNDRFLTA